MVFIDYLMMVYMGGCPNYCPLFDYRTIILSTTHIGTTNSVDTFLSSLFRQATCMLFLTGIHLPPQVETIVLRQGF